MYSKSSLIMPVFMICFACANGNDLVRQNEYPQRGTMIIQYYGTGNNYTQGLEEDLYYKQRYFSRPINAIQKRLKNVYEKKHIFSAGVDRVWIAVKNVSAKLEILGEHPTDTIDDKNNTVRNVSSETNLNYSILSDEFLIHVEYVSEMQSSVVVTRKIMELDRAIRASHSIFSSGVIENWILTQIQNEVGKDL